MLLGHGYFIKCKLHIHFIKYYFEKKLKLVSERNINNGIIFQFMARKIDPSQPYAFGDMYGPIGTRGINNSELLRYCY